MYPPNPYRNYSMEGSSSLTPPISFPSYHRDTMYPHHFVNPMSMNFSTSIGDIDVQTPTQWAGPPPPPPRPASWLPSYPGSAFEQAISVSAHVGTDLKRILNHQTMFVCNIRSGGTLHHQQLTYPIHDLETPTTMLIQNVSVKRGPPLPTIFNHTK